jgi:hypothetical protein
MHQDTETNGVPPVKSRYEDKGMAKLATKQADEVYAIPRIPSHKRKRPILSLLLTPRPSFRLGASADHPHEERVERKKPSVN